MCRKIIFVYGFSNILDFSRMFCLCLFLSFIGRFFLPLFLVSVEWNREYVYIATGSICVYSEKCLCWFFFSLFLLYKNVFVGLFIRFFSIHWQVYFYLSQVCVEKNRVSYFLVVLLFSCCYCFFGDFSFCVMLNFSY